MDIIIINIFYEKIIFLLRPKDNGSQIFESQSIGHISHFVNALTNRGVIH